MFSSFFGIVSLITQLLPLISQAIHIVETLFPQSGQGAIKAQAVVDIVAGAAQATGATADNVSQITKVLGPVIASIVALKNATGIFSKGDNKGPTQDAPPVSTVAVDYKG